MLLAIDVVLLPDFCSRFCGESTEWKLQQLDDKLNDLLSGKSAQFDLNCSPKKSNSTFTMAPVKDALFALKVVGPMLLPNVYCPWREVEGQFRPICGHILPMQFSRTEVFVAVRECCELGLNDTTSKTQTARSEN